MKKLSREDQDANYACSALLLAFRLNHNGPKKAALPLAQRWRSYFFFCANKLRPLSVVMRLIWATATISLRTEVRLIRLRRQVCILALCENPDIGQLILAIQAEREAWERGLLGTSWSIQTMTAVRSAAEVGISLRDAANAFRHGLIRSVNGVLVPAQIRPLAAGGLIGVTTFGYFGAIAYNMYVIKPLALEESLLVLTCGIAAAAWIGHTVYAAARDEKALVTRLVDAHRLRAISKRFP